MNDGNGDEKRFGNKPASLTIKPGSSIETSFEQVKIILRLRSGHWEEG